MAKNNKQTAVQDGVSKMVTLGSNRANALNFLPFNIYVFKQYLIDY